MISAPNRHPRLSGSNPWGVIALLSVLLLHTGCALFSAVPKENRPAVGAELDPIQGRRVYDPDLGQYVVVSKAPTEPMDTLRWTLSDKAPIVSPSGNEARSKVKVLSTDPVTNSVRLNSYKVVYALPFLTDRFQIDGGKLPLNSAWAMQFYAGARMALDELKAEGVNFEVSVLDTKATDAGMADILRNSAAFREANLIFGPYRASNVKMAADAIRLSGAVLVSPHSVTEIGAENNPGYLQVNPSFRSHLEVILGHVQANFRPDQVLLLARNRPVELDRISLLQDIWKSMRPGAAPLAQHQLEDEGDNANFKFTIAPLFKDKDTMAIVVPSWSSENFIDVLLKQMDKQRTENTHFVVYGMPQWMEYERIDYALYQQLNLHLSATQYIDRDNLLVQDFQRSYFVRYGELPSREAYMGYDMTRYYGKMMYKYGTRFQFMLRADPGTGLHNRFEMQPIIAPGDYQGEIPPVRYYENKFVHLLKFQDFRFSPVGE